MYSTYKTVGRECEIDIRHFLVISYSHNTYFLQDTFSMFFSGSPQHTLSILFPGCSMFSPLHKKSFKLLYSCHMPSIRLLCLHGVSTYSFFRVNRLDLPHFFVAKRASNMLFLVCKTLHNMTILPRIYLRMLFLSGKTPTTCGFLPVQYLRPAPTHRNVR